MNIIIINPYLYDPFYFKNLFEILRLKRLWIPYNDSLQKAVKASQLMTKLADPFQNSVWKAEMLTAKHARYFSTFNQFAGILGQTSFERQMTFARNMKLL